MDSLSLGPASGGIMLFLAVFCGFLAEYQLEHKIEKDRGKEYIKSFREDLAKDTAILQTSIYVLKKIVLPEIRLRK